ncbi:MAG: IS3 family transposase [Acidaminococcaceae bacterium]|nr:IS3 family transposase [Acidaminococcaceae bacterium]
MKTFWFRQTWKPTRFFTVTEDTSIQTGSFTKKLVKAGMIQSMSRVAKCIDNEPIEGFWGILKPKRYYGKRFTSKDSLIQMITDYIDYYNQKRLQRNLRVLTPMKKHELYLAA